MTNTLDMREIRYLNLFERIMNVRTRFCFTYNGMIFFCVPQNLVLKSVGENGRNVKKIAEIIGKRVRVIPLPRGAKDEEIKNFIVKIISPIHFKKFEVNDSDGKSEIVITAGKSKAMLLGRDKRRLLEMQKIIKDFFGKEFRIV